MKSYTEVELKAIRQAFCKTNYQDFRYPGVYGADDELTALTAQVEMSGQTFLDTDQSMNLEAKWEGSKTGEGCLPQSLYLQIAPPLVKPDRSLNRCVDQQLRSPRYLRRNSLVNKNKTGRSFHLKL
ncbi:MAG: hypothetical protein V1897_01305 [Pseudomonadota bacterium]